MAKRKGVVTCVEANVVACSIGLGGIDVGCSKFADYRKFSFPANGWGCFQDERTDLRRFPEGDTGWVSRSLDS